MKYDYIGKFPSTNFIGDEELSSVRESIQTRSLYRYYGFRKNSVSEILEAKLGKMFKRQFALLVSSGTAALHCALASLNIKKDDEVIIPAYGWLSDLMMVVSFQATPVIAPIDSFLSLDPSSLTNAITKKTKAIIAIHMRGMPCQIKKLINISKLYNIPLIEDGCQCLGGLTNNKTVGQNGDISIFSFQFNKLISCGEGGLILTNNKDFYNKCIRFHDLGMNRNYNEGDPLALGSIQGIGLNYRISELQSSFLAANISKKKQVIKALKINFLKVKKLIKSLIGNIDYHIFENEYNSLTNYAFLNIFFSSENDRNHAKHILLSYGIDVHTPDSNDPHNFNAWKYFLKENRMKFKILGEQSNNKLFKRNIFIEISSKVF